MILSPPQIMEEPEPGGGIMKALLDLAVFGNAIKHYQCHLRVNAASQINRAFQTIHLS